jgi:hypothetical protein
VPSPADSNAAERRQAEAWFRRKGVDPKCSQCGRGSLGLGRPIGVSVLLEDGSVGGAGAIAMVPLVCYHCAHIEWFSADMMGILSSDGGRLN